MSDSFKWNFIYEDNTADHEDAIDGFASVKQEEVKAIQLIPNRPGLHQYVMTMDASKGQRPIMFRRRAAEVNPGTGQETRGRQTVHCIGWQQTVEGKNVRNMMWVFEDGSCLVTDRDLTELT